MDVDWPAPAPSAFSSPSSLVESPTARELDARIVIGHHQLKDLISCPERRGELFYVSGKSLSRATFPDETQGPAPKPTTTSLLSFHSLPFSLNYGCSHFALGGPTAEIALVQYLPPTAPISAWSPSIIKLRPRAQLSNSVFLSDKFRLASGYASGPGSMWGLASNNDGTVKVLGFEERAAGGGGKRAKDWRKLEISEVDVGVPVNHSSLSPDGKTLISVGDSSEVYLFSVMHGGEKFKRIATYHGGEEAGFSTSWSHDGRRFAVASQDGLISVWDHRSSHKLSTLTTDPPVPYDHRPNNAHHQHTTFSSSPAPLSSQPTASLSSLPPRPTTPTPPLSPARVVKFSPSSTHPELLAYTDDISHLYLVDGLLLPQDPSARTVLTIPTGEPGGLSLEQRGARHTLLTSQEEDEGGGKTYVGTSGVCWSPCGGWVYAGTEAGIGEWEVGGGGRKRGWRVRGVGEVG